MRARPPPEMLATVMSRCDPDGKRIRHHHARFACRTAFSAVGVALLVAGCGGGSGTTTSVPVPKITLGTAGTAPAYYAQATSLSAAKTTCRTQYHAMRQRLRQLGAIPSTAGVWFVMPPSQGPTTLWLCKAAQPYNNGQPW